MRHLLIAAALLLPLTAAATEQHEAPISTSVRLILTRANAPPGSCGCFTLVGGAADASLPVWSRLRLAVEVAGDHAGQVPGTASPISTITLAAGPRYTVFSLAGRHTRHQVFVQVLAGAARGFDGQFGPTTTPASGTGFALLAGGGYQVALGRNLGLRAVQLDFRETGLPNGSDNRQRNFRFGTGITWSFGVPAR